MNTSAAVRQVKVAIVGRTGGNSIQYTNLFKLPRPLFLAIAEDIYNTKRDQQLKDYLLAHKLPEGTPHFSISDLIRPPRMRVLMRRHFKEVIKDAAQDIYRILGQAVHYFLREAAVHAQLEKEGYIAEDRMFCHLQIDGATVVISGEPDIVTPEGVIEDYKVVAVGQWIKGAKEEWEQQTNSYAFLRTMRGLVTTGLRICYILRDWKNSEAVQEGYPPAGGQTEDIRLWGVDEQKAWIEARVKLHLGAEHSFDDDLPECTPSEMWEKPDAWAVIREGNKRAAKVFTPQRWIDGGKSSSEAKEATALEAGADNIERNKNPKILSGKEKPYYVEHRPGERTRCIRFCDARGFCSVHKEYASAAFGKVGNPDRVTENV